MSESPSALQVHEADGVVQLIFNRPAALNPLSRALARDFVTALREADASAAVKAVVVTGAGERAFCAGVDLEEAKEMTAERVPAWFGDVAECYRQVLLVDKPVVAALNGVAAGGGYQISLVADWRIGCERTRMTQPEINAGLPSIMGAYWMRFHLPWSVNQELSYSGRVMDAEECQRLGLLNERVPATDLLGAAVARALFLADKAPVAFRHTKARFREFALAGFDDAFAAAVAGMQAAYREGAPQAAMARFLAARGARR
jgi:enoyl-CoA hydratase/carnithine racemase